jgi:transposase-like protein
MVERDSNTVILYPVNDRSQNTLVPLTMRHVEHGATIYSDGWSAYCDLNDLEYRHFSVIHKCTFKTKYRNVETGDIVTVHTNQIEGAWKHAKQHFKRMSGTSIKQFGGYLAEVIWRSRIKVNLYVPFLMH